ncbi:MAG: 5-(carboxyamino)imidazole ribonucleotide synthase [Beijerinckiaceae bacterium]
MAEPLKPGDVIGILGGGQLGRMLALAAARLGLRCHIYAPEADSPAFDVAWRKTVASYADEVALRSFAADVACATFEFENVPAKAIEIIAQRTPVRPGASALAVCQDRLAEKTLAGETGAATAAFAMVDNAADLAAALAHLGLPAVLKIRRFGYDGKGQFVIRRAEEQEAALLAMGGQPAILESFVPFVREVSVVAARGLDGVVKAWPVTENEHRDQILRRSIVPAHLHPATARQALDIAAALARAMEYVGVFAVEFFVINDAAGERVLVNEIAPRVHNSGHWTLDGADTSQFEQHIRAVAGLPLGSTAPRASRIEMTNLIGGDAADWTRLLAEPGAQLHLYGKGEMRAGRKMGHVTRLFRE